MSWWQDLKTGSEVTEDDQQTIKESVEIPQTDRGSPKWSTEDDGLLGNVPEPLSEKESRERMEYIEREVSNIKSQNRRADCYMFRRLHGVRLLAFDSLGEKERNEVLDNSHASVTDLALRKHRTMLFSQQQSAKSIVAKYYGDVRRYLGVTEDAELTESEVEKLEQLYEWLIFQLQFDSMKWLQIPRTVNRMAMLADVVMRLFVECYMTSSIIPADTLKKWYAKNSDHWQHVMKKSVVFIVIRSTLSDNFWDLLIDDVQQIIGNGKSVVFVSSDDPKKIIPVDVASDYRKMLVPRNQKLLAALKLEKTDLKPSFEVTE